VIQAPAWLPYRWRDRWDQSRVVHALRRLDTTAPLPARLPAEADAEVHVLLCRRDLELGLLTLKSLLRAQDLRLAVTLTDDGSLSATDRAWVSEHVPNSLWLPRRVPDVERSEALRAFPRLATLYAGSYHPICKLLHPLLLGRCERTIVVDPDTAFFKPSPFLEEWTRGGGTAWYLHDAPEKERQVPDVVRQAFADLANRLTAKAGRPWRLDYYYFNSGLLFYERSRCDLALAEEFLAWRETAPRALWEGTPGIWFGDWTPEQTAYLVLFAMMDPASRPLAAEFNLGNAPDTVFNHFMRHYVVQADTLRRLRRLVAALPRRSPQS
jgi:hypothetical protein